MYIYIYIFLKTGCVVTICRLLLLPAGDELLKHYQPVKFPVLGHRTPLLNVR